MPSRISRYQPATTRGFGVGVLTFAVGYLITWIVAADDAARITNGGPFGSNIAEWKQVLWVFFDSHFVGTQYPRIVDQGGAVIGGGQIVDTVTALGIEYMYVVPVVFLVGAGATVATLVDASTPRDGMVAGMTVVTGYFLGVLAGVFLGSAGGIGPSPIRAVVIAGLVYPIAFGGLGGVFGHRLTTEPTTVRR